MTSMMLRKRAGKSGESLPEYRALRDGEIRILILEGGKFGSPLHAKFEHLMLNDVEEYWRARDHVWWWWAQKSKLMYEAISYAWGATDMPHNITINRHLSVPLTASLFQALQRFRKPHRSRRIWADAICIRQTNLEEKSAQVAMMGEVYASARRVLIWLGEGSGFDWLAFHWAVSSERVSIVPEEPQEQLVRILRVLESAVKRCGCCRGPNMDSKAGAEEALIKCTLMGCRSLVQRPWFSRLWVVQELMMARDAMFQSGEHQCDVHQLHWLVSDLWSMLRRSENPDVLDGDCRPVPTFPIRDYLDLEVLSNIREYLNAGKRRLFMSDTPGVPLFLATVLLNAHRASSNPLDRIYAISNMTGLTDILGLEPDYNLAPIELFSTVVLGCLAQDTVQDPVDRYGLHPAMLLALAGHTHVNSGYDDWPSWVPAFDRLPSAGSIGEYGRYRVRYHYPNWPRWTPGGLACVVSSSHELILKGTSFARIEKLVPGSKVGKNGCLDSIQSIEHVANLYLRIAPSNIPPNLVGMSKTLPNVDMLHKLFQLVSLPPDSEEGKELATRLHTRGFAMLEFLPGRYCAIIRTETESYFALVPEQAQHGDRLCIIYGAPWPFVIRQRKETELYELIGDAYVHCMEETTAIGSDTEKQNTIVLR